jgi:hypothetical protein
MQIARCVAILWALAAAPAAGPVAWAQQLPPTSPTAAPATKIDGSWPIVLRPSVPSDPPAQPPSAWSEQEVAAARTRCAALLKGLDVVTVPADPIREGAACGTPAPVQLISIGSNPPVSFSPPAVLTCEMVAALHKWLTRDVQPLARKHLGSPVAGVSTMSSFSCRNAYGRAKTRLSEHGRVNALDIGAFLTAKGEATQVVADWGPISREIAAKAAEAQAEAVKRQAEAAAAARKAKATPAPQEGPRLATPQAVKAYQATATLPAGVPGISLSIRPPGESTDLSTGFGWAPPSRLGGPKEAAGAEPAQPSGKAAFLRGVHKTACTIFATVLGPEANKAHKNHFHLDMAERKSAAICE